MTRKNTDSKCEGCEEYSEDASLFTVNDKLVMLCPVCSGIIDRVAALTMPKGRFSNPALILPPKEKPDPAALHRGDIVRQFQRATDANKEFKGRRNAVGH